MTERKIMQVQVGDYFQFGTEIVRIHKKTSDSCYFDVKTMSGAVINLHIRQLQQIFINAENLRALGFTSDCKLMHITFQRHYDYAFNPPKYCYAELSSDGTFIRKKINHVHELQNALRIFGIEIEACLEL